MHLPARALRCLFTVAPLVVATDAGAQVQDPFAPGTRWTAAPAVGAPWIPSSVDFAAGGELVFASGAFGHPSWLVFSSSEPAGAGGQIQPWFEVSAASATLSNMSVRCGDQARELFALSQIPEPDSAHRRTEITRFDALAAGGLAAAWTHDMGWRVNGTAKLAAAADGSRAVAVVHDGVQQALRIEWLDGTTGAVSMRIDQSAGTLRQFAASRDTGIVAFVAGLDLWVFDSSGALRHHEALIASTQALSLSGDGATLLVGAPGLLRVLHWNSSAFVERARESAPAAEIPVRCALSHDGNTWAAGWWNANTGRDVRLELRAAPLDALVWQELQTAANTAPQNYPEAVCISRDGARAVFGVWGSLDAQPEVVLVDRGLGASIARLDLPGSVTALALDQSATRLAIGMKHSHANQFASTGEVRLFDSGERDLQALSQAQLGGTLNLTARRSGAGSVWFLYGPRSNAPSSLAGVAGTLWLSRRTLSVQRVTADFSGRADASLPIPWSVPGSGVPYSVQALFRSAQGSGLSLTLLDPLAL